MGSRPSEEELERALEFCSKYFNPASPEHLGSASKEGLPKDILDVTALFIDHRVLESTISKTREHTNSKGDRQSSVYAEDLKLDLDQINGRRVVNWEYTINNLESEDINGFVVRLKQGSLGLISTGTILEVDH